MNVDHQENRCENEKYFDDSTREDGALCLLSLAVLFFFVVVFILWHRAGVSCSCLPFTTEEVSPVLGEPAELLAESYLVDKCIPINIQVVDC